MYIIKIKRFCRSCFASLCWSMVVSIVLLGCTVPNNSERSVEVMIERPNVLLIVVDDMGFSDIGSFGGEIETPNLDALAHEGLRLTNFHTASTCSPTRSMLLTGVDHHRAGLGNMLEELSPNQKGQPGYEGYLNDRVVTLPELLQDDGYFTVLSGKWHLGQGAGYRPTDRGFDRSFSLIPGGASHFADMRPAYAPSPDIKAKYEQDGELLDRLPENFDYSSQFYVDYLIDRLREQEGKQPFFAYLSFTAPHWPLQAPDAAIAKYRGKYDSGYDHLLSRRLHQAKLKGVIPSDAGVNVAPPAYRPWTSLSADEQKIEARAMEIYAAMIDEIDRHTGRLLQHLEDSGELENTLIIFMSDNGAEAHDLDETWPADLFPKIRKTIDESHDFSYENMGRPGSYVLYGHGWGRAGSPAFSLYKAFPTEGGTRVAAFAWHPKLVRGGAIDNTRLSVKDVTPTILDLLDIEHPGTQYEGREVEPMTGWSILPVLAGDHEPQKFAERVTGSELFGKRSITHGAWKIVHMPVPYGNDRWQLFNLEQDLAERHDLAMTHPEKLEQMQRFWDAYYEENDIILPDWVSGY